MAKINEKHALPKKGREKLKIIKCWHMNYADSRNQKGVLSAQERAKR